MIDSDNNVLTYYNKIKAIDMIVEISIKINLNKTKTTKTRWILFSNLARQYYSKQHLLDSWLQLTLLSCYMIEKLYARGRTQHWATAKANKKHRTLCRQKIINNTHVWPSHKVTGTHCERVHREWERERARVCKNSIEALH